MKLKYKKNIMLSLLSTMGIGLLTLSIGHGKTRSEEIMNTGISKESVVVTTASSDTDVNTIGAKDITQPNAVPSPTILPMPTSLPASTPTPLPVYELEEDKYPEIDALIQLYYLSKNNCDMEKLKRLLWDPSQLESESSLKSLSKIMEDYRNIKCYTKKGYIEGNYIVYVYLDYKIININTLAPGVVEFYLITDADGNLKIYSGDIDPVLKAYYDARDNDEDVQKLKKEVDNKGEEARAKDKSLDTFWQYLDDLE